MSDSEEDALLCPSCGFEWERGSATASLNCPECGIESRPVSDFEEVPDQDEHELQRRGIELQEGDAVLVNDRVRELEVVGKHKRQNQSRTWRRRGVGKYRTVVKMTGNGTSYHLLCTPGSEVEPMLYKEGDWDDEKTDRLGQSPKYSRGGERVEAIEVV